MDFLDKFVNEIHNLEGKYYEINLLYDDGKTKNSFDLLNIDNEIINLGFNTATERNVLKVIYYSYAIEYFAKYDSNEDLDLAFPVGNTLALNYVLTNLANIRADMKYHVESYVKKVLASDDGPDYEFLKELADWYSVNIINKRLPYKVTMDAIHRGLFVSNNKDNLIKLKESIFIDTANVIIANAHRFSELTVEEVKVIKCSILFSFLEEAKARRLVDEFLKKITSEYSESENAQPDILIKIIASFGKQKYQLFESRFRKSNVWRATNFTNNINNFEDLMMSDFNIIEVSDQVMKVIEEEHEEEIKQVEGMDEKVSTTNDIEEELESTMVINVEEIRKQYNLETESNDEEVLEIVDDYIEEDTSEAIEEVNEDDNSMHLEIEGMDMCNVDEEVEEIIVEDLEGLIDEDLEELVNEDQGKLVEDVSMELVEEESIKVEDDDEELVKSKFDGENIAMKIENGISEIEALVDKHEKSTNGNILEEDEDIPLEVNEEDEDMNGLEGLDELIGSLRPAEEVAERTSRARNEKVKEELTTVINIIQSTEIENFAYIPFLPLKEVISILGAKNYKLEKAEKGMKISW